MKELAERICRLIESGQPAVLATILSRRGSAPRTAGSKMVVDDRGGYAGTIGGGKFEADVLAEAARVMSQKRPSRMFFDLTNDDVSAMDMICGGKMEVLVDYLAPEKNVAEVFRVWKSALSDARPGVLVTVMAGTYTAVEKTAHYMLFENGEVAGAWPLSEDLRKRLAGETKAFVSSKVIEAEGAQLLVEPTSAPKTLLIFGAGHVSMPTACLAAEVGFRVVVVDDRQEFANRYRFPGADDIRVPEDFSSSFSGLPIDADTFVVIVTRGHRYDKEVLAWALHTPAAYIGMIGSRSKRNAIYASLENEGFSKTGLARVHCPIGLSIGAETPEEIAVSIAAELIQCRAGKRQDSEDRTQLRRCLAEFQIQNKL